MHQLITGAARSGKSRYAEARALALARQQGTAPHYLATAQATDDEMRERIRQHRDRRGGDWQEHEEPLHLADQLRRLCGDGRLVLVECLGVWINNCLHHDCWPRQRRALMDALPALPGHLIMVASEAGGGITPANPLARRFVDENGALNQQLAAHCQQVTAVMAGIPLRLKPA